MTSSLGFHRFPLALALAVTLGWSASPLAKADDASAFLRTDENLKVMPLGDSITFGKNSGLGGDRRVLYEWLLAGGRRRQMNLYELNSR